MCAFELHQATHTHPPTTTTTVSYVTPPFCVGYVQVVHGGGDGGDGAYPRGSSSMFHSAPLQQEAGPSPMSSGVGGLLPPIMHLAAAGGGGAGRAAQMHRSSHPQQQQQQQAGAGSGHGVHGGGGGSGHRGVQRQQQHHLLVQPTSSAGAPTNTLASWGGTPGAGGRRGQL